MSLKNKSQEWVNAVDRAVDMLRELAEREDLKSEGKDAVLESLADDLSVAHDAMQELHWFLRDVNKVGGSEW